MHKIWNRSHVPVYEAYEITLKFVLFYSCWQHSFKLNQMASSELALATTITQIWCGFGKKRGNIRCAMIKWHPCVCMCSCLNVLQLHRNWIDWAGILEYFFNSSDLYWRSRNISEMPNSLSVQRIEYSHERKNSLDAILCILIDAHTHALSLRLSLCSPLEPYAHQFVSRAHLFYVVWHYHQNLHALQNTHLEWYN